MEKVSNLQLLINRLKVLKPSIIIIDGYPGTGKSTVASFLSDSLGLNYISVDSYLVPHQGTYLSSLKYESLKLALKSRPIIIEGICLLEILHRLDEHYDCLVYISAPITLKNPDEKILEEIREYHGKWKPHHCANIVFENNKPLNINTGENSMTTDRTTIDLAYIKSRTQFAIVLACGGMLSLVVGLIVLLSGTEGKDETIVQFGDFNLSAKGLGAVIMGTSSIWAFFSYQSRPGYSHSRESIEEIDPQSNRTYRREIESSTVAQAKDKSNNK